MTFGLEQHIIDKIISVFEANAKVDKAYVFGSRAKGNYRPYSDIDIAIKGIDITLDDILKMSVAFEDMGIKNKIDLIDYTSIKEPALQEHIDRVGIEFYSRWKEHKIADIISLEYGKSLLDYRNGTGKYDVFGTNGKIGTSNEFLYDKPSLIIGRKGAYREVHLSKKPFFVIDTAFYTKNKMTDLDTLFLYFWFKNIDINEMDSGSAIPSTSRDEVYDVDIKLPPFSEQTAIASILSSLDDKIDLLQRQNKTLEQLAETLFRQWFVEEAEENWEETTLEKHTEVFRGLSYKGSGLTEENMGLPMHNLNSVYEGGGYKYEGIKFYSEEYRERHLVNVGDIIVTNTEQGHEYKLIGFPAIVPDYYGKKGLFSQHIYKLVPLPQSYLSREFLYYLLMISTVREQIIAATNGSTVNMLALDGLQLPLFKLPPKEKVINFTSLVKDYWTKKNVNQNQIRTLTHTRDALLPKLISGEVRVNI